jgi:hypothetical protein
VLEHRAKLPYRDYVIGNPFDEPVKIEAPIYSAEGIKAIEAKGFAWTKHEVALHQRIKE